jgi:hypothetical protein
LAEAWNGSTWSIQGTPDRPGAADALNGVSCASPNACVAAGRARTFAAGRPFDRTLAEGWDGTGWTIQATRDRTPVSPRFDPSPPPGSSLAAVSCPAAAYCVAVGSFVADDLTEHPLAERGP